MATYRVITDRQGREALEIIEAREDKKVIDKQSTIDEIARLQALLDLFPR
jgi:hypothetical protein